MRTERCLLLYVDEEEERAAPRLSGGVLRNARLVDPASGREVGSAGVGAWEGVRAAVDAAVLDAIRQGGL